MKDKILLLTLSIGIGLTLTLINDKTLQAQEHSLDTLSPTLVSQTNPLTPAMLKNATYQIPDQGSVTLTNGTYQATSGTPLSVSLSDKIAFGDVNGDGINEAATILAVNTGGSGTFLYLAAVVTENGSPENVDTIGLGDRIKVNTLAINAGKITLTMLKHSPTDPVCCPSQEIIQAYQLNQSTDKLALVALTEEEKNPGKPKIEDVPLPPLEREANEPDDAPEGEIEIKF